MPDREKVFDALRNCITEPKCKDCPWETCEEFHQTKTIPLDLCLDILKLLKEQKPIEPVKDGNGCLLCGNQGIGCGVVGLYDIETGKTTERYCNYCPDCGRSVKWE